MSPEIAFDLDARIEPGAYRGLRAAVGWSEPVVGDAELAAALARTWTVVAREGRRVVGIGRLLDDGALYATICDMIVLPSHQRQGIGRGILEYLVERSATRTIVSLVATAAGRPLYEAAGFRLESRGSVGMLIRPA
jgi:GNAT superfamily N-acetyltransferase